MTVAPNDISTLEQRTPKNQSDRLYSDGVLLASVKYHRYLYPYQDIENTGPCSCMHTWNQTVSMYSNVKSKVSYSGSTSDAFDNTLGVRQGDCLSPFLFAMYINDIEHSLSQCNTGIMFGGFKIVTLLYADDVIFMILLSESAEGLQRGLDCMY